jgi:hypothetical protein
VLLQHLIGTYVPQAFPQLPEGQDIHVNVVPADYESTEASET